MDPTQPLELHPRDVAQGLPSIHVMLAAEDKEDPEWDDNIAMSPDVETVIPHISVPPPCMQTNPYARCVCDVCDVC